MTPTYFRLRRLARSRIDSTASSNETPAFTWTRPTRTATDANVKSPRAPLAPSAVLGTSAPTSSATASNTAAAIEAVDFERMIIS
ncbi:MAG: hypothetical protein E6H52_02130 [Betaproteobacteria bacterium]|nr:MAG: hypothetical protein E6H52_02130 [Betaproteobacteria bacterium]